MPIYTYTALNSQGKELRNEIEAESPEAALTKIRSLDLFPTDIREKTAKRGKATGELKRSKKKSLAFGRVKQADLTAFTRQLSTLIEAGLPIVRSLRILEDQLKPGPLKNDLIEITEDVEGGLPLSEALSKHPRTFRKIYCQMVKAGEAAGILDQILNRLATFMEKAMELRRRVVSAMMYPAVVVTAATGILILILVLIVRRFQSIFRELNVELPFMTRVLLQVSEQVQQYWFLLPAIPLGFYLGMKLVVMNPTGRLVVDKVKLHVPVFGNIIQKSTISRFTRTLGTLLASGVPILDALTIVRDATGNAVVGAAIGQVHDSIREGEDIAGPLAQSRICDGMVVNMVAVGEETGELDRMLIRVSDHYDNEVDAKVAGLTSVIEPILILGMGIMVGFIVIALFWPMVKLIQEMSANA